MASCPSLWTVRRPLPPVGALYALPVHPQKVRALGWPHAAASLFFWSWAEGSASLHLKKKTPSGERTAKLGRVGAKKMRQHTYCSGCYCSKVALLDLPAPAPSPCSCSNPGVLTKVVFLG